MWEQSMQMEALRLLGAWWDSSRPIRALWGRRPARIDPQTPDWRQGTEVVSDPTLATP